MGSDCIIAWLLLFYFFLFRAFKKPSVSSDFVDIKHLISFAVDQSKRNTY